MDEADCPFCEHNAHKLDPLTARESNGSAFAIYPLGSVTSDQILVAPLQHSVTFQKLQPLQITDIHALSCEWIKRFKLGSKELRGVAGNFGEIAGQTVPHLHIHFPNFGPNELRFGTIEDALRNDLKPSGMTDKNLLSKGHFTLSAKASKYIEIGTQEIIDLFSEAGNKMVSLSESDESIRGFNLYANEQVDRGPKSSTALIFNFIPRRSDDMINEDHRRGGCMSSLKRQIARYTSN